MPSIRAEISRYVDDEPQPGIVECILVDAFGETHFFIEKTAIVSSETLLATSTYPTACELACEIEAKWDEQGGKSLLRVSTERPWGIESVAGVTRFVVQSSQVLRNEPVA